MVDRERSKKFKSVSKARKKAVDVDCTSSGEDELESSDSSEFSHAEELTTESNDSVDNAAASVSARRPSKGNPPKSDTDSTSDSDADIQPASLSKSTASSSKMVNRSVSEPGSTNASKEGSSYKGVAVGQGKVVPREDDSMDCQSRKNTAIGDQNVNDVQIDRRHTQPLLKEEFQAPAMLIDETVRVTASVQNSGAEAELSSEEEHIILARKTPFRESGCPEDMVERLEAHHLYNPQDCLDAGMTEGIMEIWEFVKGEAPFDTDPRTHPTKVETYLMKKHMSRELERIKACLAAQNGARHKN